MNNVKNVIYAAFIILIIGIILAILVRYSDKSDKNRISYNSQMKILSNLFSENGKIPSIYTCDGQNISPSLIFSDVPVQAKSLALIMDDPDALMRTFVH